MSFTDLVHATKTALSSDPAQAQAKFEAHHDLVGPCEVTVRVGSGHKFTVDEPEALGGGNVAANPVEYALAALGSCQAITYRVWAAQLGIKLDKVEIGIDGDIDLRHDVGDRAGSVFSINGDADELGTGLVEGAHLRDRAAHVRRVGIRHRLDDDRVGGTHRNAADGDGDGPPAIPRGHRIKSNLRKRRRAGGLAAARHDTPVRA